MANKPIQVFEYQKLAVGTLDFEERHFNAMVKFNEKNNNKYFDVGYNKIIFKNYVGVIQINGLTIEILPKADNSNNTNLWQKVLLQMLEECKLLKVDTVSETQLKKRYNSILESYFSLYLQEIEQLVKRGLVKKYRKKQSNQFALKGKLLFGKNIQKNVVHKERFYCEHQVYDKNHLIHQILLAGLQILNELEISKLNNKIKKLLFEFEDVVVGKITQAHFKKIVINRKTKPYEKALNIAKMLILNYSPNISSGNEKMLTLLFDMNMLWEEYIFRVLYKNKNNYKVSRQKKKVFWEQKKIKPDIVITTKNGENYIIDTKWKIIKANKPSDDDLRQMFAYNLYWQSSKSMLLYPKTNQPKTDFGNYVYKHHETKENQCKLGFVSVLENGKIKKGKDLCNEILRTIDLTVI